MSALATDSAMPLRAILARHRGQALRLRLLLLVMLVAAGLVALGAGDYPIAPERVLATLFGVGEGREPFIILTLRLPRLVTALAAGMAFGVAGAIFQSLARNPLASPDIIGFDSGAALGAVAIVVIVGAGGYAVAGGAIVGGLVTAAIVLGLAWRRPLAPLRLILVGIGVGVVCNALMSFLLSRGDIWEASAAQAWLTGSLNARTWTQALVACVGAALLVPLALLTKPALDQVELGDDLAAALGIPVDRARLLAGLVAVLLAALAVGAAGPLPFVALVAAPIARRLSGLSGPDLVTAGLIGALLVLLADLAGRLLFAPVQLPAGIFTAMFGAPYLLWLLATQIRRGTM